MIAVIALLAAVAVIVATTAAELFADVSPFLGVVVPVIVAFAVRYKAAKTVKFAVTVIITVGVGVTSIAMQDWSMFSVGLLFERATMALGQAQFVYFTVSEAVERWTPVDSINALPVFRPESGLG